MDDQVPGCDVAVGWTLTKAHAIRWSECDLFGHVNHAAYLTLFEDLRVDYWTARSGEVLAAAQPGPVVSRLEVRYLHPVRFAETVTLACRTIAVRRTSFTQDYALWSVGGLACTARGVCVVMVNATGARTAIPTAIRSRMVDHEGARDELLS